VEWGNTVVMSKCFEQTWKVSNIS